MMAVDEACVPIRSDADLVTARVQGRQMAAELGFSGSDLVMIATAISELARNILTYAGTGELIVGVVREGGRRGIAVVARDQGPGIPDTARAMQDGYSTSSSLGMGLPGAKRLMDDFDIVSEVGVGTTVTIKKWVR